MAGRLTAAAHHGGNRTRPQIAETAEFFEEFGSIRFQATPGVRHVYSILDVIIRSERRHKKRKTPITAFCVVRPLTGAVLAVFFFMAIILTYVGVRTKRCTLSSPLAA